MLKIKDNTSKQKLSVSNCEFWNDFKISYTLRKLKCVRNGIIYINDITVDYYNKIENFMFPKSNASFVKRVRQLNKQNYFDNLVKKIEE